MTQGTRSVILGISIFCVTAMLLSFMKNNVPANPKEGSAQPKIIKSIMKLESSAFKNGEKIPAKYTCKGEGINPPLIVTGIPPNAKSLALTLEDPDAPRTTFDHWVVWNIPTTTTITEEGIPPAGIFGKNSLGEKSYVPPCPPSGEHHYYFRLYALDVELPQNLDLMGGGTKTGLLNAMNGHILDTAELLGVYGK